MKEIRSVTSGPAEGQICGNCELFDPNNAWQQPLGTTYDGRTKGFCRARNGLLLGQRTQEQPCGKRPVAFVRRKS